MSVDDEPVVELGENAAVTPPGTPLTLNARLAVKPVPRETSTLNEVLAPWTTVREVGDSAIVKLA